MEEKWWKNISVIQTGPSPLKYSLETGCMFLCKIFWNVNYVLVLIDGKFIGLVQTVIYPISLDSPDYQFSFLCVSFLNLTYQVHVQFFFFSRW